MAWFSESKKWGRKAIAVSTGALVTLGVLYYLHQYHTHLNVDYAEDWQFGRREAAIESARLASRFDTVVVSPALDMPYAFWLFHLAYDPATYQQEGGTVSGGFKEERNRFGKYRFRTLREYAPTPLEKVLFVGLPSEVFPKANVLSTIQYPSGQRAFVLFEK